MSDEMKYGIVKTGKPVTIEKIQYDLQLLRNEVKNLEIQMTTITNTYVGKINEDVEASQPPYPTMVKCQRCNKCKNIRMPHKSNPHYTCTLRHATIEPTWSCGLFSDKKGQKKSASVAFVGH